MKRITIEWQDDESPQKTNFEGPITMLEAIERLSRLTEVIAKKLRATAAPAEPHQEKREKIKVVSGGMLGGNGKLRGPG